jgi:hypothetical protein
MPTAGSDVDIVLQTSALGTITGLMLARSPDGSAVGYQATRLPAIPNAPLTYTQRSWHLGFGDYLARREDPFRYAFSDGVDARYPNSLQLIPNIKERDFILTNPGGERGGNAGWTAGGNTTITASTTTEKDGDYGLVMTTGGSKGSASSLMLDNLDNPTLFQSVTVTVGCYLRRTTDGGSGVLLRVNDDVGSNDSATVTSSSYTFVEATRTFDAGAASVTIDIRSAAAETGVSVYEMDSMFIIFAHGDNKPRAMQEYNGAIYLACGSTISTWDVGNARFELVKTVGADANINGLASHGSFIYAAVAKDDTYFYSNDVVDERTAWTTVSNDGRYLVPGIKHNGRRTLYGVLDDLYQVRPSNEVAGAAVTTTKWGNAQDVGDRDTKITNIYWALDTLLVAKEDGLFYYYAPDDTYHAVTDQFKVIRDTENFDVGMEFTDGWFYTATARHGLIRLRFEQGDALWQPVSPRYSSPFYDDFGGRIRALTHDGTWMYALMDTPIDDDIITKEVTLMAARPDQQGNLTWHTLARIDLGVIGGMFVEADELYMFGTRNNTDLATDAQVPYIFRMALPKQHENMMKDATVNVNGPLATGLSRTGTFVTPIMDFADEGYQHDDKGWLKVELTLENITANQTVTVEEQIDDAIDDASSANWTAVGTAITSTTTGQATVSFAAATAGKRCRLRFKLATNVTTSGPIIREYRVFAIPSPEQYYAWDLTCHIGTGMQLLNGQRDARTAGNILAFIETLGGEDYPLLFNDLDGTQYKVNIDSWEKITLPLDTQSVGAGMDTEHLEQGVRLRLREVKTT